MFAPKNSNGKLEWFKGNVDALMVYRYLVDLAHIWDDLVDQDKDVTAEDITYAFAIPLAILPQNAFWQFIEPEIRNFWPAVVASYMTANAYEKAKDEHGLEISHGLRYAVGQVFTYIFVKLHGAVNAQPVLQEAWLSMMPERFEVYKKERTNAV